MVDLYCVSIADSFVYILLLKLKRNDRKVTVDKIEIWQLVLYI